MISRYFKSFQDISIFFCEILWTSGNSFLSELVSSLSKAPRAALRLRDGVWRDTEIRWGDRLVYVSIAITYHGFSWSLLGCSLNECLPAPFLSAQVPVVLSSISLMGDLGVFYLHLANSLSQLLLWAKPPASVTCDCSCGVAIGVESCSVLVKEVLGFCVESTISTHTTSTTPGVQSDWSLGWLWLLILVFCAGIGFGKCLPLFRRAQRVRAPIPAPVTDSPGSRSDSSIRPRRGQVAWSEQWLPGH